VGRLFAKSDLTRLLRNVIYTGKVHFQGQTYAGEHIAIAEERVWRRVHDLLGENAAWDRRRAGARGPSERGHASANGDFARPGASPHARKRRRENVEVQCRSDATGRLDAAMLRKLTRFAAFGERPVRV
jgi:hypothetical protein